MVFIWKGTLEDQKWKGKDVESEIIVSCSTFKTMPEIKWLVKRLMWGKCAGFIRKHKNTAYKPYYFFFFCKSFLKWNLDHENSQKRNDSALLGNYIVNHYAIYRVSLADTCHPVFFIASGLHQYWHLPDVSSFDFFPLCCKWVGMETTLCWQHDMWFKAKCILTQMNSSGICL